MQSKSEHQIILGWIELGNNASDSRMVKKNWDELSSVLASDSSRDLIHPGLEVGYYNFHVLGFPLTVLEENYTTRFIYVNQG